MSFFTMAIFGLLVSVVTMIQGKPEKIFKEVYLVSPALLFIGSAYLLLAIFYPAIELKPFIWGLLYVPNLLLCGIIRKCWYKERGRDFPWWGF